MKEKIMNQMVPAVAAVTGLPGTYAINASVVQELQYNNCTMPDVKNVVYNLKTDEDVRENGVVVKKPLARPVLTTVVFFVDGTKAVVQNSANDPITLTQHVLTDGSTVTVADQESKERGFLYAVVKRLVSRIDSNGNSVDGALGSLLKNVVKDSHDNQIVDAETRASRAANKKRHAELQAQAAAKPTVKRYTIGETLARMNEFMAKIESKI